MRTLLGEVDAQIYICREGFTEVALELLSLFTASTTYVSVHEKN